MKKLNLLLPSPSDTPREVSHSANGLPPGYASSRAALLFGCYRKAEASDPEIYAAAIAAILSEYSKQIVDYITDPRTGLPSKSKWLPSVFEVREACEDHAVHLEKLARYNAIMARKAQA